MASLPTMLDSVPMLEGDNIGMEDVPMDEDVPPVPELSHTLEALGECGISTLYGPLNQLIAHVVNMTCCAGVTNAR